jgi:hypothetical protein
MAMEYEDENEEDGTTTDDVTTTDDDDDEAAAAAGGGGGGCDNDDGASPLADFITQTDRHGIASTPRSMSGGAMIDHSVRNRHENRRGGGHIAVDSAIVVGDEDDDDDVAMIDGDVGIDVRKKDGDDGGMKDGASDRIASDDACEQLIDGIRRMCCCLLPGAEDGMQPSSGVGGGARVGVADATSDVDVDGRGDGDGDDDDGTRERRRRRTSYSSSSSYPSSPPTTAAAIGRRDVQTTTPGYPTEHHPAGYSTRGHDAPPLMEEDSALTDNPRNIRLLPDIHRDDVGKKCLVLDLDETLVHSSFRAVPGADFVIPVQVRSFVRSRMHVHIFVPSISSSAVVLDAAPGE